MPLIEIKAEVQSLVRAVYELAAAAREVASAIRGPEMQPRQQIDPRSVSVEYVNNRESMAADLEEMFQELQNYPAGAREEILKETAKRLGW